MLSILFLYYIGKQFYDLAELNNKSKWGFGILGVVSFYAGTFVSGIILALLMSPEAVESMNDLVLGLISIPLGLVFAWIFYKILEHNWSKLQDNYVEGDILDQNLNNPNQGL